MSYINLSQAQVVEVVERELRMQMYSYYFDYDSPDIDTVKEIYSVWRMFATSDNVEFLKTNCPEIWEATRQGFRSSAG